MIDQYPTPAVACESWIGDLVDELLGRGTPERSAAFERHRTDCESCCGEYLASAAMARLLRGPVGIMGVR